MVTMKRMATMKMAEGNGEGGNGGNNEAVDEVNNDGLMKVRNQTLREQGGDKDGGGTRGVLKLTLMAMMMTVTGWRRRQRRKVLKR